MMWRSSRRVGRLRCSRPGASFDDNGGIIEPEGGTMLGFLKNVLGGGGGGESEPEGAEPVEHEGFAIVATPRKASGGR